jgi:hypothetical protein
MCRASTVSPRTRYGTNVADLGHDQRPRAGPTPWAAESWVLSQLRNRLRYPLDHETRCYRIVNGNEGRCFVEVA